MTIFLGHKDNPFLPDEPSFPHCPVCGEECETIYKIFTASHSTEIIGCDMCYNPGDFPGEDVQEDDPWEDSRCMEDY